MMFAKNGVNEQAGAAMCKYFIGIDCGGTTTRAAIYSLTGEQIALSLKQTQLKSLGKGVTERSMEEFRNAVEECLFEVVTCSNVDINQILAITVCGHGKGLYLLDKNNKPLENGIVSTDTRAASYIQMWKKNGTLEKVRNLTLQNILASQPCALLRWIKDNDREKYNQIGTVFSAKDYIRYCLTGEINGEYTDFSGTSLLNLNTRDYDNALLELFGIEEIRPALPGLKGAFDICGKLSDDVAARCGLKKDTLVAGGMFDINACALASGLTDEKDMCVIAGTWSINEYISSYPIQDGSVDMNSLFCIPNLYLVEESSPTSAGNLAWLVNEILNLDKNEAEKQGVSVFKTLDDKAANIPADMDVFYLPYIFGSQNDPCSRGAFIGIDSSAQKGTLVRAVLEGVAFNHRMHVEKLLLSRKNNLPAKIRLSGGAAKSKIWTQIFADILNMPVLTTSTDELGTLGCAITGAVATNTYANLNEAIAAMVRTGEIFYPSQKNVEIYNNKYKKFKILEKKLRGM